MSECRRHNLIRHGLSPSNPHVTDFLSAYFGLADLRLYL